MHSCNKDRPNVNCQDECRTTEVGYIPPAWCMVGGGIDGLCGATYPICLLGTSDVTAGIITQWMCLGSDVPQ